MIRLPARAIFGIILALLVVGAIFAWQRFGRGLMPSILPPPGDITEEIPPAAPPGTPPAENTTGMPLKLPPGFSISIFAKNLPGARAMRFDRFDNLWVSRTADGAVSLLETKKGIVSQQSDVFTNLKKPHGLAFDPADPLVLYIAEENAVRRIRTYGEDEGEIALDLPSGGGHFTRTLGFGPDGKLYVSVGSSCNVCDEKDERRATILRFDPVSRASEIFARGLRNAVFFTWDSQGRMIATEMGRDFLGDNLPPDEVNVITQGKFYGWPICYGKNIHDTDFDKKTYIRNPCLEPFETPSFIDIPAHSAPLGIAVIPDSWPEEYQGDLLVAYHGSWNRTEPTGYKVVRWKLDANGNPDGAEDFITGWLDKNGALGRPVDLIFDTHNNLYISDDKAGVIYRVTPPR